MKLSKRSVAGAMMAGIVLAGVTTTSASADIVKCTKNTVASTWEADCTRYTDDGDAGGVSGTVWLNKRSDPEEFAWVSFSADGELVSTTNQSDLTFWVELQWYDSAGRTHRDFFRKLEPGDEAEANLSIPEGRKVQIGIQTLTGGKGARTNRLVA
ncbi:hypothetical protein ACFIN9_37585 [Streptomyces noursei]|uniref:hypothetical protein n=1 Tax=Streptomyces noursei TaxID=1971 RepID=UPI0036D2C92A